MRSCGPFLMQTWPVALPRKEPKALSWKLSARVCFSKRCPLPPHTPFSFFLLRQSVRLPLLQPRNSPSPTPLCERLAALSLRRDPAGDWMRAIRCPNGQRAFLELGVMSGTKGGSYYGMAAWHGLPWVCASRS